jgi:hypothetical protein
MRRKLHSSQRPAAEEMQQAARREQVRALVSLLEHEQPIGDVEDGGEPDRPFRRGRGGLGGEAAVERERLPRRVRIELPPRRIVRCRRALRQGKDERWQQETRRHATSLGPPRPEAILWPLVCEPDQGANTAVRQSAEALGTPVRKGGRSSESQGAEFAVMMTA